MAQAMMIVERTAELPTDWLTIRPDIIVIQELPDETPAEFALRIVRRLDAALSQGEVEEAHYFTGVGESTSRFHSRCVIARALLRAMATGARSQLTFFASGYEQPELFTLVDTLRTQLNDGFFEVRLSFTPASDEAASGAPISGVRTASPADIALSA